MTERRSRRLRAALALLVALAPTAGAEESEQALASAATEFSEAETRMWLTDQLKAITRAMELRYRFEKTGTLEEGFTDEVRFVIDRVNPDGSKAVSVQFFSGERNIPVPPVDGATVNLVLGKYMEGDVREMNRLTDPDNSARERWRYFQRRIKAALAESAEVRPTRFEFDGRNWSGHEISFAPYVDDPHRQQFERYADKRYRIVVSDELPGYLYRIETEIPGEQGGKPLIREVLQLVSATP
jgi:hypothetical protein